MAYQGHLTDKQWNRIRIHLPKSKRNPKGGRPRLDERRCFEGILWILWTGSPWHALPKEYGSPSTCWRRLREWEDEGTLLNLWRSFLADLNDREKIRWDECFGDGTFIPAKKGAHRSAKLSAAKAQSAWFWSMARVLRWDFTWTRQPRQR
jgi:transposase